MNEGSRAIESHLKNEPATGRYCNGDALSLADVCLVAHILPSRLFGCDTTQFPIATRIVEECMKLDAFARAHPLKQPGAPAH